jgi:hypothetical protein
VIAYLHGFNSGHDPNNVKITALRKIDREVMGVQYNTFATRTRVVDYLVDSLQSAADDLLLVGTSLGAYYAAAVAKILAVPCVLINPCVDPFSNFSGRCLDIEYTNFVTGRIARLTAETVQSFKGHPIALDGYAYRPLVLLADSDEVFDSDVTAETLADFEVVRFPSGSHRFEQMSDALQIIENYVNLCSVAADLNS